MKNELFETPETVKSHKDLFYSHYVKEVNKMTEDYN